jgi:hypothetical protein
MNDCQLAIFLVKIGKPNDLVTKVLRRLRR